MPYLFVVIKHGSRRMVHCNVTMHPTAAWTLQQLREVAGPDHECRFLLHDRDNIVSRELDESIEALGISALKSAPHFPGMNSICERVTGPLRRERLDWIVPLSESQLRTVLKTWTQHNSRWKPHMALGPGIPDLQAIALTMSCSRCRRGESYSVQAEIIVGGLHEYRPTAA